VIQLWDGLLGNFIEDINSNVLYSKITERWVNYHNYPPSTSEFRSWQNSLPSICNVLRELPNKDVGVVVEYHFPYSGKRIDVAVFGKQPNNGHYSAIIELKQWDKCELYDEFNENVKVGVQPHIHPSQQALDYIENLSEFHSAFTVNGVKGTSCSYLHNFKKIRKSPLYDKRFHSLLDICPAFGAGEEGKLLSFLKKHIGDGDGAEGLRSFTGGYFKPSKKIIDSLKETVKGDKNWVLLDGQRLAYNEINAAVRKALMARTKSVFIIRGAPGTGKSVVAVQLLKDALVADWKALYFTPGFGFRVNLQAEFRGAQRLFRSPANVRQFDDEELDIVLVDESHRLAENATPYMPLPVGGTPIPDYLIEKSKVTVFFIDDRQRLRPLEVGSVSYLKNLAKRKKTRIKVLDLETQFRCRGSLKYIQWLDKSIYGVGKIPQSWQGEYSFKIMDSPRELEKTIKKHCKKGEKSRMVAGFCWPWSNQCDDGSLINDVKIGNWEKPWNRKKVRGMSSSAPKDPYVLWARDDDAIDQIGCIYSSQGIEFDYVGVIWGDDLVIRDGQWVAQRENIEDKPVKRVKDEETITNLLANAYMVLMTRGMKGTYLYCVDAETREYFAEMLTANADEKEVARISVIAPDNPIVSKKAYKTLLPLYSLKAAAGYHSGERSVEAEGWVEVEDIGKLDKDMFVAQVVGRSMEPMINDGAYCVFRFNPAGTRQGKIVLVQYRGPADPDTGGSYTIKKYSSAKTVESGGEWLHSQITLLPLNPDYEPIVFTPENVDEVRVIAQLLTSLG